MNTIAVSLPLQVSMTEFRLAIESLCSQKGGALISTPAISTKDGGRIAHLTYAAKQRCARPTDGYK